MKNKFLILLALISLAVIGCGEGSVDINEAKYEPKIVMQGFIYPDKKVEGIQITRNFPLNQNVDVTTLFLYNANVTLTNLSTNEIDTLKFNFKNFSFEDDDNNFQITEGLEYKLNVSAVIEGKLLQASSITKVPYKGLKIDENFLGDMKYREKDAGGNVKSFNISFTPSPQGEFYAFSIIPLDSTIEDYIVDNAYTDAHHKDDYKKELDKYRKQMAWMQNVNSNAEKLNFPIEWFYIWFYGRYRVIIYAADINYKDFLLTYNQVQEFDGNFHEPKFHIEGDGIGVFASAVVDTTYFEILK